MTAAADSVQSASFFLLFMAEAFLEELLSQWLQVFRESDTEHRMLLLYVMNDVLQNGRVLDSSSAATDRLKHRLLPALQEGVVQVGDDTRLQRLLQVWRERNIFNEDELQQLEGGMGWRSERRARLRDAKRWLAQALTRLHAGQDQEHQPDDERYREVVEAVRTAHALAAEEVNGEEETMR